MAEMTGGYKDSKNDWQPVRVGDLKAKFSVARLLAYDRRGGGITHTLGVLEGMTLAQTSCSYTLKRSVTDSFCTFSLIALITSSASGTPSFCA